MADSERIHKFYSEDLMLRVSAVNTTGIVQKMCSLQSTFPLASIALGRALTGALLMASQMRDGQRVGLYFRGDGPLGSIFAEANYESEARGYCHNAQADLPLKNGHLDIAGGVGKGILTVTRSQPFEKQPHNGIVPIYSGEIGEDLAHYLYQSHQIFSIVSLAVSLDGDGSILTAGGVYIELMPGADEKLISTLEAKLKSAKPLSQSLAAGASPMQLAQSLTHDSKLIPVQHPWAISYTCKCTRDRVDRTLFLLGKGALAEMVLKGTDVAITCQFCGRNYTVTVAELRTVHDSIT